MTDDKFTRDAADAAAKAHDDEVYAVEQNAQNFESIGCAITVLGRTDSRTMPADVRKMLHEVRAKLSLAHSILVNEVASDGVQPERWRGDVFKRGHMQRIGAIADALPTADDATQSAAARIMNEQRRKTYGQPRKLTKAAPSLGAQLADLRTIIDKVEAARARVAQRNCILDGGVDLPSSKAELRFYDVLDLLVDARQLAIDMRDEVERTLGGKFLQLRDLKVGDCFRFKNPPPGWTDGKLQLMEDHPGFAMPEGWDFFPIELLDGEVERISPSVIADEIRADGGIDIPSLDIPSLKQWDDVVSVPLDAVGFRSFAENNASPAHLMTLFTIVQNEMLRRNLPIPSDKE